MTGQSTGSSEARNTRSIFRFLAYVVAVVYAVFAVASLIWDMGALENTVFMFFAAVIFVYMAAGGTFSNRTAKMRMRLHLLARLYVANRITLEEFGEQARQVLDRGTPSV